MSSWVNSVRRTAVGAISAGVISGGLLFGAAGIAEAAPAPAPATTPVASAGFQHAPMPEWWGHHHHRLWRHHHGFGRMWFWR